MFPSQVEELASCHLGLEHVDGKYFYLLNVAFQRDLRNV
jgi:hypothetical protein